MRSPYLVTVELGLTARAESVNSVNTPQFADRNFGLTSPSIGQITNPLNDGRTFRPPLQFDIRAGYQRLEDGRLSLVIVGLTSVQGCDELQDLEPFRSIESGTGPPSAQRPRQALGVSSAIQASGCAGTTWSNRPRQSVRRRPTRLSRFQSALAQHRPTRYRRCGLRRSGILVQPLGLFPGIGQNPASFHGP